MDRIYRARQGMGGCYVLERDSVFYWLGGDIYGDYWPGKEIGANEKLSWLAPVRPSIVVAIGLNYKDHAAEMNKKLPEEPLVFLKPSTAVIGPDEPIRLPAWAGRIEHEAEMAVVIGRRASRCQGGRGDELRARRHLPERRHRARAAGQGRAVLARQGLRHLRADRPLHRGRARSVDARRSRAGSTASSRHNSNTSQLIFPVPYLIEHVTRFMTLRARRHDHHRHALGRRPSEARRSR